VPMPHKMLVTHSIHPSASAAKIRRGQNLGYTGTFGLGFL
jgi:hypothetical protein